MIFDKYGKVDDCDEDGVDIDDATDNDYIIVYVEGSTNRSRMRSVGDRQGGDDETIDWIRDGGSE